MRNLQFLVHTNFDKFGVAGWIYLPKNINLRNISKPPYSKYTLNALFPDLENMNISEIKVYF